MERKEIGYLGENCAAHFLQSKGYTITGNNFTVRGGEIDLIAEQDNQTVFIEVKTRTSQTFGEGDESLHSYKKRHLLRAIDRYITRLKDDADYRVDLVEVTLNPQSHRLTSITHFEDIEL